MSVYVMALLIGVVAGLRAMTAPAVVSWAAYLGRMHLESTWLAFLGSAWIPYILSALAIAELVTDQLPKTPSRKVPMQFGVRIITGGFCGTALGTSGGTLIGGLATGVRGRGRNARRLRVPDKAGGDDRRQGPSNRIP
jgi:uncharacterized membrane protein